MNERYLHPGQLLISQTPCKVTTILGTCVSVCLFDPLERWGGMNHFMLPYRIEGKLASTQFGCSSTASLIREFVRLGCQLQRLTAKLFGGATMHIRPERGWLLGDENVAVAEEVLKQHGITVVGRDVGGVRGRKLVYRTHDGQCDVIYLGGN